LKKIKLEEIAGEHIILFEGGLRNVARASRFSSVFQIDYTGGTGLSIVYQIIRDHNGTINVRSLETPPERR